MASMNELRRLAGLPEARETPDAEGAKAGEWNIIISKGAYRSKWSIFIQNPQGGGSGGDTSPSQKGALKQSWRSVKADKAWIVIKEWDPEKEDYVVKKSFYADKPVKECVENEFDSSGLGEQRCLAGITSPFSDRVHALPEAPAASEAEEDLGDFLREVMRWLKPEAAKAETFAERLDATLKAATTKGTPKLGKQRYNELLAVWDMLSTLSGLLDQSHAVAKDAMLGTALGEAKGGAGDAINSLSRWLRGATPVVGSYTKKVNDAMGTMKLPDKAQRAFIQLADLLRDLERLIMELDPVTQQVLDGLDK